MDQKQAIDGFAALAHDLRLSIVRSLIIAGPEGLRAGELAARVNAAPSKLSFHLAILKDAELIFSERAARQIIYRMRYAGVAALADYLMTECCAESGCEGNACT